jgi:hypothetical protein
MILATASCAAVKYKDPKFETRTVEHRLVAVLPFEMVLDGNLPADLTPAQIAQVEEEESLAFQRAMYHALLNQSGAGKGRVRIDLQPVSETNRMLRTLGFSVQRTWAMSPEVLADILGVDAVVRTRVEKTRFLSEGASAGIDLGTRVVHEATQWRYAGIVPQDLAKTYDVFADASLFNGDDGGLLWKIAVQRAADWERPPNEVIASVVRKLAKKFPYRV